MIGRRSLFANFSRQGRSLAFGERRRNETRSRRFGLNSTWEKRLRIRLLRGNGSAPFVPVAIDAPRCPKLPSRRALSPVY